MEWVYEEEASADTEHECYTAETDGWWLTIDEREDGRWDWLSQSDDVERRGTLSSLDDAKDAAERAAKEE